MSKQAKRATRDGTQFYLFKQSQTARGLLATLASDVEEITIRNSFVSQVIQLLYDCHATIILPTYTCTVGLSRIERWNRAAKFNFDPPEDIRKIVLKHPDDKRYTHWYALVICRYS